MDDGPLGCLGVILQIVAVLILLFVVYVFVSCIR